MFFGLFLRKNYKNALWGIGGVQKRRIQGILGAKNTILTHCPDLLVSMYHRSRDLFDLPLLIKEINPEYELYLRRFPYVPAWDLNLYAIKG